MRNFIRQIRRLQGRIRVLWRVMPLRDAVHLTLAENRPGETRIYLRPVSKEVVVRRQTTDLRCLEKVFIAGEYYSPFQLSPQVIVDAGQMSAWQLCSLPDTIRRLALWLSKPESSNFEMLKQNCEAVPDVTLIRAALWPENRELKIENSRAGAWMRFRFPMSIANLRIHPGCRR